MRADKIADAGYIIDVKTTQDAGSAAFGRSAFNYRYDVQGAFYTDGAESNGLVVDAFCFIAIEKDPPYAVAVYFLDSKDVALGRQRYKTNLIKYQECVAAGQWPCYPNEAQPIQLPQWALK
jgi:exodeoxyribonuclease VIII